MKYQIAVFIWIFKYYFKYFCLPTIWYFKYQILCRIFPVRLLCNQRMLSMLMTSLACHSSSSWQRLCHRLSLPTHCSCVFSSPSKYILYFANGSTVDNSVTEKSMTRQSVIADFASSSTWQVTLNNSPVACLCICPIMSTDIIVHKNLST